MIEQMHVIYICVQQHRATGPCTYLGRCPTYDLLTANSAKDQSIGAERLGKFNTYAHRDQSVAVLFRRCVGNVLWPETEHDVSAYK